MITTLPDLVSHLLARLRQVQHELGMEITESGAGLRFADAIDSMGMVEFLALVGHDCGTTAEAIEQCAGRQFSTVWQLAEELLAAGLLPRPDTAPALTPSFAPRAEAALCWIGSPAVILPRAVQSGAALDAALGRPAGWLERHAGIGQRHVWDREDPLDAVGTAASECLERAGLLPEEVGTLLVTSEAPPLLAGLAAALHHRLSLRPETAALEVGGACTGFLAALTLAQALVPRVGAVMIACVEAPSRYLTVQPGPTGEAAALFGDGAAAVVMADERPHGEAILLREVLLRADGGGGHLLRVERTPSGAVELHMDGTALATRAVRAMAQAARDMALRHGLAVADLAVVVAHGGNGRMPAVLARQLDLSPDRVWSEAARTGNLGSASLPAAWAVRQPCPAGPIVWTAVGAGLAWGAAITGSPPR